MSKSKDEGTVTLSAHGESVTVTGKQFSDLADGKMPLPDVRSASITRDEAQKAMNVAKAILETPDPDATIEPKQPDMFGYVPMQIYKSVIDWDGEKVTQYTRAPSFDAAKAKFAKTRYIADSDGIFLSISEVAGKWVE